jgi:hypothetical protein
MQERSGIRSSSVQCLTEQRIASASPSSPWYSNAFLFGGTFAIELRSHCEARTHCESRHCLQQQSPNRLPQQPENALAILSRFLERSPPLNLPNVFCRSAPSGGVWNSGQRAKQYPQSKIAT